MKSNLESVLHRLTKRLKQKNNYSDDGRMIRLEYVDDEENENSDESNQNQSEENHDDVD